MENTPPITLNLDHLSKELNGCFGISDEKRHNIWASVIFHYLYRKHLSETLFDEDKVPDGFNCKSNIIEDVINEECQSVEEQIYAALEYGRFDARLNMEDRKMIMTLLAFDLKLTKLNYDKEKFFKWHLEMVNAAEAEGDDE